MAAAVGDEEAWGAAAEELELENVIQPEAAFAAEARDLEPDLEHYCLADPEFPGIRLRPTRDGDCAAAYVDEGIMALMRTLCQTPPALAPRPTTRVRATAL